MNTHRDFKNAAPMFIRAYLERLINALGTTKAAKHEKLSKSAFQALIKKYEVKV